MAAGQVLRGTESLKTPGLVAGEQMPLRAALGPRQVQACEDERVYTSPVEGAVIFQATRSSPLARERTQGPGGVGAHRSSLILCSDPLVKGEIRRVKGTEGWGVGGGWGEAGVHMLEVAEDYGGCGRHSQAEKLQPHDCDNAL